MFLYFMLDALLLQVPHKMWPLVSEGDNFLPPQALLQIAAVLEQAGLNIRVMDCCVLRYGWATLRRILERWSPAVVGVGGPITWMQENIRGLKLAKEINPDIKTVCGGPHPTLVPQDFVKPGSPVDFVVYGEGEYTFLELVKEVQKPKERQDLSQIRGLVYLKNGKAHFNPPRPLLQNLDDLPLPAYHMVPMERYAQHHGLWPNCSSLYHSKGCVGDCNFCACWPLAGNIKSWDGDIMDVTPHWRTKSVSRTMEEMKLLEDKYKRTLFMFVDDCWNVDPKWNEEFAEQKKAWGIKSEWFAFMRLDFIVRDWKRGIIKKLYDSGMRHIIVGVERSTQKFLDDLEKWGYSPSKTALAAQIIRQECPKTFLQGTFINGLWDDTEETILAQADYAKKIGIDYPSMHALTPFPGTRLWHFYADLGVKMTHNWEDYDFWVSVVPTQHLTRNQVAQITQKVLMKFSSDPVWLLKGLTTKGKLRRGIYWWFVSRIAMVMVKPLTRGINPFHADPNPQNTAFFRIVAPPWYET